MAGNKSRLTPDSSYLNCWKRGICSVGMNFRILPNAGETGHEKEFEAVLQKLHGKDADISEEVAEIQDYIETLQLLPKASILDLFQRRYLSSVIIGVRLMVVQQFGGINGVCFYASNIFKEAGLSSSVGTITYAILQVIVTAIGAALVDRAGRKPLLLISGTGLVLGCIVTALSFFLKVHDLAADAVPILAVTGILVIVSPALSCCANSTKLQT